MESQEPKKKNQRGLFERPPGSGVWWINYYIDGKQHREKAGTITAARQLYQKRKADDRDGKKLPRLRNTRFVTIGELIDDVLEYTVDHKDKRSYISKAEIVKKDLGALSATNFKPQDLSRWLREHTKTPATHNRYKAFLSLCYRLGNQNDKVDVNPARKVRPRKEAAGRMRFYSHDEYRMMLDIIRRRFPEHEAEFIVAVHTGMRLSEQYTVTWGQVNFERREITLYETKDGTGRRVQTGRRVHLNEDAIAALRSLQRPGQRPKDPVFPRQGPTFDTRSWMKPCWEEAKIDDAVHHTARHTFCSWLAEKGASAHEIMAAAGHKTLAVSARYTHLNPKHTQSVVDRIATAKPEHAPVHAPEVFRDHIERTGK
jgi:integrase